MSESKTQIKLVDRPTRTYQTVNLTETFTITPDQIPPKKWTARDEKGDVIVERPRMIDIRLVLEGAGVAEPVEVPVKLAAVKTRKRAKAVENEVAPEPEDSAELNLE